MAKKKTGVGTLPHEIMMEAWRKEGKVHREELSLKAIKLDHRLQAREKHLDLDHVKELHGYVKDGAVFPPIIVFRIGGKDFVANGFHRCDVHKKEGRPSITADVVDGTWQQAVEFATCCNFANAALAPKTADKKKAAFMLFENGWLNRTMVDIAKQVGASPSGVSAWRAQYCEASGKPVPRETITSHGQIRSRPWKTTDEGIASPRTRRRNAIKPQSSALFRSMGQIAVRLSSHGIWVDTGFGAKTKGLAGGRVRRFALTCICEDLKSLSTPKSADALVLAVGRAVLLAEHHESLHKVVVVHHPVEIHGIVVSIARRLGVEFMTLEQFVEAVKADEGEGKE